MSIPGKFHSTSHGKLGLRSIVWVLGLATIIVVLVVVIRVLLYFVTRD